MTRAPRNGNSTVVPFLGIRLPDGFDVCWAGPSPLGDLCFGSTDGSILFADEQGRPLHGSEPGTGSVSGEAINGVVRAGTWAAVSTRSDVNFWPLPGAAGGDAEGWAAPYGAHGVSVAMSGRVVAPLGRKGIMVVEPPFGPTSSVIALGDNEKGLYIYRVISLRSQSGTEVLACAARTGGVAAGAFSGPNATYRMRTAAFNGIDVIDICPLDSGGNSPALAALGRDGAIIMFRDVLTEEKPIRMKFKKIQGTAYRLLSHRGELYVLTSRGLYALGKLASRFLDRELHAGVETQILTMPMDAIDATLAGDRWLLVVTPDEVRRIEADWIHDNVPETTAGQEAQDFQPIDVGWRDINTSARQLVVA